MFIKKELQPDNYQCGPWALYLLQERATNPEVDFNDLDIAEAQNMIADYRLKVVEKLKIANKKFAVPMHKELWKLFYETD